MKLGVTGTGSWTVGLLVKCLKLLPPQFSIAIRYFPKFQRRPITNQHFEFQTLLSSLR